MALYQKLFLFIVLLSSIGVLAYIPSQSDFLWIISSYSVAFFAYYFLLKFKWTATELLILAAVIRIILIPAFPNLSDDLYRFIWDGNLIVEGVNPYIHLPTEITEKYDWASVDGELFTQMNSPEYYTIYPPLNQFVFGISSLLGGGQLFGSMLVMKICLFLAELSTVLLLIKLLQLKKLDISLAGIYAFNPLAINEIMTNMHFEGMMLLFLLIGIFMLKKNKLFYSVTAIAVSIGVKLIPLMFMPLLIPYLGFKKAFRYFLMLGIVLLIVFFPIWINLPFFLQSLDLYFQKFEFNASVYYVFRWIGFKVYGYNQIAKLGPLLALCTIGIIVLLSVNLYKRKSSHLATYFLYALTAYLIFATTVHPWYIIPMVGIASLTPYRYPLFWSFLITFTYINYSYDPYHENLWFVSFEYLTLFAVLFWDFIIRKTPSAQ